MARNLFKKNESAAAGNNTNEETKVKSLVWVNIGATLKVKQEDGTMADEFISMPVGIALDTQTPMEIRGKNKAWHHKVQAKNMILQMLQAVGEELEPGEGEIISDLQIQVFRKNDAPDEADAGDNDLLDQLSSLGRVVG